MQFRGYTTEGELGRGATAVVYRARSPEGATVALKVVRLARAHQAERFQRERRLAAKLGEAEGFVVLLDAWTEGEHAFLVMPFVSGGTLRARLERGRMSDDDAVAVVTALARAVGRAHALGIVHRDLKPENVLFLADGRPLVVDLGIAKHFRPEAPGASLSVALSRTRETRGTAGYMAPEQLHSSRDVGPPADVFALGAILHECLTGDPAIAGDTVLEVLARTESAAVSRLEDSRPDAPRWLRGVLSRALAREPRARFPDGEALARALETRDPGARPRVWPALAVLVVTAAALAVAAFLSFARPAPVPAPTPSPSPAAAVAVQPFPAAASTFLHTRTAHLAAFAGSYGWKAAQGIVSVALSPDGTGALSGGCEGEMVLWDLATGEATRRFAATPGIVRAVAFSPDGSRAASGNEDGTLCVWSVATGDELARLDAHHGGTRAVSFSPDGSRLVSGGADGAVRVWKLGSEPTIDAAAVASSVLAFEPPKGSAVAAVAFAPDGLRVVSGAVGKTLTVWDLTAARAEDAAIVRSPATPAGIHAVAFLRERVIAGSEDGTLQVSYVKDGGRLESLHAPLGKLHGFAFHEGRGVVLTAGPGRVARLIDVDRALANEGKGVVATLETRADPVAVALSADGRRALIATERTLELRDLDTGKVLAGPERGPGHSDLVRALAVSADGRTLLSGSFDHTVRVWDAASLRELRVLRGHDGFVPDVAFVPGSHRALSASFDHTARLWDLGTGALVATLEGHAGEVNAVACLPRGDRALTGSYDATVKLWDLPSGRLVRTLSGHTKPVFSVAVSLDGKVGLSTGSDRTLRFWDLATGSALAVKGPEAPSGSTCVRVLPDGRALTVFADQKLHLWDVAHHEAVGEVKLPSGFVLWSADGRGGKVLSQDGRGRAWLHSEAGERLDMVELRANHDWPACVAFGPDGRSFFVGTARGIVLRFELD